MHLLASFLGFLTVHVFKKKKKNFKHTASNQKLGGGKGWEINCMDELAASAMQTEEQNRGWGLGTRLLRGIVH